ncbi:hypothetical protein ACFLR7_01140 [Acidobacteriota bacterium]
MKKITFAIKLLAVIPLAFALVACNPIENETTSASMLIVNNLMGEDMEGNLANYLESDVLFEDPDEGITTIYADPAVASLTVRLLDPASLTGPSNLNSVTVDRYQVSYSRTDGRNTEGVDVPYAHEGSLSALISVDNSRDISFTVVRAAAKAEPPLVDLHTGRDLGVITCIAKVVFFGKDITGRAVKATGHLTIHFANYANTSGGSAASAAGSQIQ